MRLRDIKQGRVYIRMGKESRAKVMSYEPGAELLRFHYTEGAGKGADYYQEPAEFARGCLRLVAPTAPGRRQGGGE